MTTENNNENIQTATEENDQVIVAPSIKTIGELIKKKREEKNLSLKVISQHTKVHIGLLEHLENNELDKLPSKTYVRGFIKSTAKILGINELEALNLLDLTYEQKIPAKEQKIYHAPPTENKINNNLNNNNLLNVENLKSIIISYSLTGLKFGLGLGVVIVLGISLKNYVSSSNETTKTKIPVVLSILHQKSKTPVKKVAPEVNKNEAKVEEPIKVNLIQDSKKTEVVTNTTSENKEVALKPTSSTEKQFTHEAEPSKEDLDKFLPSRFRVLPTKGLETVFINATDGDSWITYKIDDKEIKKYVLRQGRTVFMRGATVRIFIGNTKNVKVFYNNKLLNLNAKSAMKNLVFPDSIKDKFMTPLFIFQKDGTVITSDQAPKPN